VESFRMPRGLCKAPCPAPASPPPGRLPRDAPGPPHCRFAAPLAPSFNKTQRETASKLCPAFSNSLTDPLQTSRNGKLIAEWRRTSFLASLTCPGNFRRGVKGDWSFPQVQGLELARKVVSHLSRLWNKPAGTAPSGLPRAGPHWGFSGPSELPYPIYFLQELPTRGITLHPPKNGSSS